jgi:hypothetical protein
VAPLALTGALEPEPASATGGRRGLALAGVAATAVRVPATIGEMQRGHRQTRTAGAVEFYRCAMRALRDAGVPFLVGGAYSLVHYTGVERESKDLDLFLRRADFPAAAAALGACGYRVELTYGHWLGKAHHGEDFVDLLFGSGNGLAAVDDVWFAYAGRTTLLGVEVLVCPLEETIWSKAFVMERERFDGADVLHLLRARAEAVDWERLLAAFGPHWRVLLAHLVLFGFAYPSERHRVPASVLATLSQRLAAEVAAPPTSERVCRGTLLSREQYLVDLHVWGYADSRLPPHGRLTAEEVRAWTAAIWQGEGE